MKLLTRSEEMILLSVWRLQDQAFGGNIHEQLRDVTGKEWAFGALFVSLDRLGRKDLLESEMRREVPGKGGRKRRYYRLTSKGRRALVAIRQVEKTLWDGISESALAGQ